MPVARRKRREIAKGKRRANNLISAVVFDPPTFNQIRTSALKRQISFAERVRDLVELGMETERLG